MLTSRQIDRYSRQIITQGFGGAAQERLLAAHAVLVGKMKDLDPVLPYIVAAGVGHVRLDTDADATIVSLQARFKDLNPDVELAAANDSGDRCDLLLAIASDLKMVERMQHHAALHSSAPIIYTRLEATPAIAIISTRPPCLRCADADLSAPLVGGCANSGLVAMIAGLEAIKLLAGMAGAEARLIEFEGYAAASRALHTGTPSCECAQTPSL
ncbi:MAG TPA: hypothetical protein VHY56_14310 [Candidatus Binataceae bacterium]|nr:hypothetical protein [Candidatus Binataceae bacterium]